MCNLPWRREYLKAAQRLSVSIHCAVFCTLFFHTENLLMFILVLRNVLTPIPQTTNLYPWLYADLNFWVYYYLWNIYLLTVFSWFHKNISLVILQLSWLYFDLCLLGGFSKTFAVAPYISKACARLWHKSLMSKLPSYNSHPSPSTFISSYPSQRDATEYLTYDLSVISEQGISNLVIFCTSKVNSFTCLLEMAFKQPLLPLQWHSNISLPFIEHPSVLVLNYKACLSSLADSASMIGVLCQPYHFPLPDTHIIQGPCLPLCGMMRGSTIPESKSDCKEAKW